MHGRIERMAGERFSEKWDVKLFQSQPKDSSSFEELVKSVREQAIDRINERLVEQGREKLVSRFPELQIYIEFFESEHWELCFLYPLPWKKDLIRAFVYHSFSIIDESYGPIVELEGIPRESCGRFPLGPVLNKPVGHSQRET